MARTRRRWTGLLRTSAARWRGPDEGGPVCCVHLPPDGEVDREEWSVEARPGAALVRDRRCQAAVAVRGDVRHSDERPDGGGHHEGREDCLRLPPGCDRPVPAAP